MDSVCLYSSLHCWLRTLPTRVPFVPGPLSTRDLVQGLWENIIQRGSLCCCSHLLLCTSHQKKSCSSIDQCVCLKPYFLPKIMLKNKMKLLWSRHWREEKNLAFNPLIYETQVHFTECICLTSYHLSRKLGFLCERVIDRWHSTQINSLKSWGGFDCLKGGVRGTPSFIFPSYYRLLARMLKEYWVTCSKARGLLKSQSYCIVIYSRLPINRTLCSALNKSKNVAVPKVRSSNFMHYNFWSKLYFYMKFLQDVYFSIEYMYSEFQ